MNQGSFCDQVNNVTTLNSMKDSEAIFPFFIFMDKLFVPLLS